MNARAPLGQIVVAGSGLTGLLTALAMRRALPQARITLLRARADPAALADRLPALVPAARAVLERRVGLDEARLVAAGAANIRLADRFEDWGDAAWLRPFGRPGAEVGPAAFHQHWLEARRRGRADAFHLYHPAASMAAAGRFARVGPPMLDRADHALRLDPTRAAALLRAQLDGARIHCPAAAVEGARLLDVERVAAILEDGAEVTGDLMVDCTGPAAVLIGALGGGFEDWSDAIPCDRLLLASGPPRDALVDRYRAADIGWCQHMPFPSASLDAFAWPQDLASEGRARRLFGRGAAAEAIRMHPGRRHRAFVGNVVALGDAAAQIGSLGNVGLSLALGGLDLLLDLLPGLPLVEEERSEFNRRARLQAERMRDFVALPLVAAPRAHGAFWQRQAEAAHPASLSALLAQFRRRGLVPRSEEDLCEPHDWAAMLLGLGLMPACSNPIAAAEGSRQIDEALAQLARAVSMLPAHIDRVSPR